MNLLRPTAVLCSLLLGVHGVAWACSCIPNSSDDDFDDAELIIHGIVEDRVNDLPSEWDEEITTDGCNPTTFTVTRQRTTWSTSDPVTLTVSVEEVFKGEAAAGDVIEIQTVRGESSCGLNAQPGENWVFFSNGGRAFLCSGSGQVTDDDAYLGQLRELAEE